MRRDRSPAPIAVPGHKLSIKCWSIPASISSSAQAGNGVSITRWPKAPITGKPGTQRMGTVAVVESAAAGASARLMRTTAIAGVLINNMELVAMIPESMPMIVQATVMRIIWRLLAPTNHVVDQNLRRYSVVRISVR